MNIRTQITILLVAFIGIGFLMGLVKKRVLELRYALPWLIVAVGVVVLGAFPQLISRLAHLLGIGVPVNVLFFLGFCFLSCISLALTLIVSKLSDRIRVMTQKIALMEQEIDEMKQGDKRGEPWKKEEEEK